MSTADLVHTAGLSSDEHRARVSAQLQALADAGQSRSGFAVAHGGGGDLGASVTGFELLAHADLSLLVKAGVRRGLFGGAVENLGTEPPCSSSDCHWSRGRSSPTIALYERDQAR